MTNYSRVQFIGYGAVTSEPTQVLGTTSDEPYRDDVYSRANTLCRVAEYIRTQHTSRLGGENTLKVFIAPEFYFRFGGPSPDTAELRDSYPNGDQLLAEVNEQVLKPFFQREDFNHWLIVPGTMFWHRAAKDTGTGHPLYFNSVVALRGGSPVELSAQQRLANGEPGEVPTIGSSSIGQKQLMSHIDYALDDDRRDWDSALNPMYYETLGDWKFWRWHVFSVHGVNDRDGNPIVFGLEVCLEHLRSFRTHVERGVLRTLERLWPQQTSTAMPAVDLHLVTSCGMTLDDWSGVTARRGGFAAICDGMQPDEPATATWPTTSVEAITGILTGGARRSEYVYPRPRNVTLPDDLQLGLPDDYHDPLDAVAVWEPTTYRARTA